MTCFYHTVEMNVLIITRVHENNNHVQPHQAQLLIWG
jgi:hypothetical protein